VTLRGRVSNTIAGGLGTGGLVIFSLWRCLRGDVVIQSNRLFQISGDLYQKYPYIFLLFDPGESDPKALIALHPWFHLKLDIFCEATGNFFQILGGGNFDSAKFYRQSVGNCKQYEMHLLEQKLVESKFLIPNSTRNSKSHFYGDWLY
jgi:hypothetical protein